MMIFYVELLLVDAVLHLIKVKGYLRVDAELHQKKVRGLILCYEDKPVLLIMFDPSSRTSSRPFLTKLEAHKGC